MSDIFDRLSVVLDEENADIFNRIKLDVFDDLELTPEEKVLCSDELKDLIDQKISEIKPIEKIIERVVQPIIKTIPAPVVTPPPVIKEIRVEVEKKDNRKYVEESKYLDLLVKVSKLESQLKETRKIAEQPIIVPGGPGVIGIPPPEPNPIGYVLTINADKKAQWKAASGLSGFTVSNGNTLQSFDVTNTSLDEMARIVGTIIAQLQP